MTARLIPWLLLSAACGTPRTEPEEWVREYAGYLPDTGYPHVAVLLVRDARTGEPIENAIVSQYPEGEVSRDGHWAPLLGESRTDEFGLAWLRVPENTSMGHYAIHADGYAPTEEWGVAPQEVVELERGERVHGRIVGPFGKPVAGALVEYKLGCAHAPALATTRTNADGIWEFEGITGGDYPFYAAGIEADYAWSNERGALFPPEELHASPGGPIEGRILLADGTPPEWGVIRNECGSRGPMARLRRDGSFRIEGGDPEGWFELFLKSGETMIKEEFRSGGPFTYRVGAGNEPLIQKVTPDVREGGGVVVFERIADGRRWRGEANRSTSLPAGRYRAILGDPTSEFVGQSAPFDVPGPPKVSLEAYRQPRLEVVWEEPGLAPGDVELNLDSTSRHWTIGNEESVAPTHLDPGARAVIHVERQGACRNFPVAPARDGVRRVVVRMPPFKRLALPDAGAADDITIYGAHMTLRESLIVEDDAFRTRATGRIAVHLEFEDREQRVAWYEVPDEFAGTLQPKRVDRYPLPVSRELAVFGPDGERATGAKIDVQFDAVPPIWFAAISSPDPYGIYAWDERVARSPWFRDGARVLVYDEESGLVPMRVVLKGDGPYTVRWGSCTVRVRGDVEVYIDGRIPGGWEDGDWVLRGLQPGPHTLIVGATGRKHIVMRVVLTDGETRVISPRLPVREK